MRKAKPMALQVGLHLPMACFPGCKPEREERESEREGVGCDQNPSGAVLTVEGRAGVYAAQAHLLLSAVQQSPTRLR